MTKNYLQTLYLKLNINLLKMPLSVLNAIFMFMFFYNQNTFALVFLILISFAFLFDRKYLLISLGVFLVSILFFYLTMQNNVYEEIDGNFRVKSKTSFGVIIKYKGNNVFLRTYDKLNVKDIINVKGKITEVVNQNSDFDLKGYLETKNTINIILKPKIELIRKSTDIRNIFKDYLENGDSSYAKVAPLVLLGVRNNFTKEIYQMSLKMNIVHLFVISGFHLSLIYFILYFIFKKLKVSENYSLILSLFPVFVYLYFLYFSLSALRAFLFLLFNVLNKIFNKKRFNSMQIFSFSLILIFIFFPRAIYSLSFIFSFNATFMVLYANSLKFKNKVVKYFSIPFFAYVSNFLIIVYINKFISILGILYSYFLSPIIVFIYIFHILFFWFKPFCNFVDHYFLIILKIINKTNYLIYVNKFSINYLYFAYGILFIKFIIILLWNSFMELKSIWLKKKLKNL